MDRERFDAVARLLAAKPSRRAVAGTLLTMLLFGHGDETASRPGRGKTRNRRRGRRQARDSGRGFGAEQLPAACCSGGACAPGPGKNLQKCCYEGQTLPGKNFKGANLDRATFAGAILTNANFSGANLDKTCFVEATLTGAKFAGANMGTAIFCRTTMPDGSINDSGCNNDSRCCPTCTAEGDPCDLDAAPCCSGAECVAGVCTTCRDGIGRLRRHLRRHRGLPRVRVMRAHDHERRRDRPGCRRRLRRSRGSRDLSEPQHLLVVRSRHAVVLGGGEHDGPRQIRRPRSSLRGQAVAAWHARGALRRGGAGPCV